MLNPQRLRVFHEVASRGSLAAAARALTFSQSAVSQQMGALERELDTRLLERTSGGVRLTDAGRALFRHSQTILGQLREAELELQNIVAGGAGEVRIGAFPTAAATLVASAIAELHQVKPAVRVVLREADPDELLPHLAAGALDLAFDFDYDLISFDRGQEFHRLPFCEEPLLVAMPTAHPLAGRRQLQLFDLRHEPWIGGTAYACNEILRKVCSSAGFQPSIAFETNDYATVQGLIAAGVGVALVPALALEHFRPELVARKLRDVTARRRTAIVRRASGFHSIAAQHFIEALARAARHSSVHGITLVYEPQ